MVNATADGRSPRSSVPGGPGPAGLPGLDPAWSRSMTLTSSGDGVEHTWHLLDNGAEPTRGTLLCVHGNPTWSYLWRGLLAHPPEGWRVVAPDHLGMGWSDRLATPRRLADRVRDLGDLTEALGVDGPVVTVGHDWGGAISLGWAVGHRAQLRGVVLTNTAVAQPAGDRGPVLIRAAHVPLFRRFACVATPVFVRGTTALSRPALPRDVRDALAAPYASADRRRAVGEFVADIPFQGRGEHPSRPALEAIAQGVRTLEVPALLLWGPRDPVFGERYLADLRQRLPQAELHRYEGASHLVTEDAPQYAAAVSRWVADLGAGTADTGTADTGSGDTGTAGPPSYATDTEAPARRPASLWSALDERAEDGSAAVADGRGTVLSWAALARRVRDAAAGLSAAGVGGGDRVALLLEPSTDLTVAVYAVWRAGGVVVLADKGLGFAGIRRALRGAQVDHVIGSTTGLAAARLMGLNGSRVAVGASPGVARAVAADHRLEDFARLGAESPDPPLPSPDDDCAVVFTSGATGPAKGVCYRHRQVLDQLALLTATYRLGPEDRLVAGFRSRSRCSAPRSGIGSVVPDHRRDRAGDVDRDRCWPEAVDRGRRHRGLRLPRPRCATGRGRRGPARRARAGLRYRGVRLLMSAGAPVPADAARCS